MNLNKQTPDRPPLSRTFHGSIVLNLNHWVQPHLADQFGEIWRAVGYLLAAEANSRLYV
jgi:hypothetical protein